MTESINRSFVMNKSEENKQKQGFRENPQRECCGNCAHYNVTASTDVDCNVIFKRFCGIGEFSCVASSHCGKWEKNQFWFLEAIIANQALGR